MASHGSLLSLVITTTLAILCLFISTPKPCLGSTTNIETGGTQLARSSLASALNATHSAHSTIAAMAKRGGLSPRMAAAMKDCAETVGYAADELAQSIDALAHLGGKDVAFQLNSIQTWVSAAITNDFTCTDELGGDGGRVATADEEAVIKAAVRRRVTRAEQLTSSALAFINRLAANYSLTAAP